MSMAALCRSIFAERALIIQITLNAGRSTEVEKSLYRGAPTGCTSGSGFALRTCSSRLVEMSKENWPFGGVAQYAD